LMFYSIIENLEMLFPKRYHFILKSCFGCIEIFKI